MKVNKKTRNELVVLAVLLAVLALMGRYVLRGQGGAITSVFDGSPQFKPLNVPDPSLRLDLLARVQKEQYSGQQRNIFSEEPLPPTPAQIAAQKTVEEAPPPPVVPPPLTIPASFYGIVTDLDTGQRRACFSANSGDVYILPVGGMLLNQFRIVTIGRNSVQLQEISTGRTTTLVLATTSGVTANPQQAQNYE